jgi:tRNA threonylcarbamoyladenosine biosynthesis protein TsaB
LKILGIDTSSKVLSIAVSENTGIIREESHLINRKHSSLLVPKIDGLLKKSGIKIRRIDAFIVGLGPGSFTGLRIGVSTVKGFCMALKKPCIGVASIDAIARNATAGYSPIVPIIDAKRGQVYAAIYAKKWDQVIRKSGYLLIEIEKLMKKIKGEAVFLGDGVGLYREKISNLDKNAIFLEEKYWYPRAGNLIKLGFDSIKKHKKPDLSRLEPMYMYSQYCQIRSA